MSVWTFICNINIWQVFDVLLVYIYAHREDGGPGRSKLIKHSNIDHLVPNVPSKYLLPTLGVFYREEKGLHTKLDGTDSQQESPGSPCEMRNDLQRPGFSYPLKFNFIELIILSDISCKLLCW